MPVRILAGSAQDVLEYICWSFLNNFHFILGTETGVGTAPGVYLREDPISGTQLENQSELRAPTAEKAAFYLDAALNSRTKTGNSIIISNDI